MPDAHLRSLLPNLPSRRPASQQRSVHRLCPRYPTPLRSRYGAWLQANAVRGELALKKILCILHICAVLLGAPAAAPAGEHLPLPAAHSPLPAKSGISIDALMGTRFTTAYSRRIADLASYSACSIAPASYHDDTMPSCIAPPSCTRLRDPVEDATKGASAPCAAGLMPGFIEPSPPLRQCSDRRHSNAVIAR